MSTIQTVLQNETLLAEDESLTAPVRAERTDAQLVEMVLAGDSTAFESLFDRHKRLVASIGARYMRRPDQIEEVVQIAFAKTFVELKRFRGDHDLSFVGWIARITTNSCLDLLRRQRRKPEDLADDIGGFEAIHLDAAVHRSGENQLVDRDLADKLLSHVAADDRALLHMLYAEEMSIAEVAGHFGWSISKTKVKAWRARHSLRRIMKRYM
ncbi:MAG: RNA polymerase sigma factor [Acidobacteria bacterium]|nr:RNA polymerase sigma factor [Acidobacteriota bacterium]